MDPRKKKADDLPLNEEITAPQVRVVGDNIESGIYSIAKALEMAKAEEVDLVLISPNAVPPVCRIIDYKKFVYDKKKKDKEIKANSLKMVIKEIRFGPNTDEHDFLFKIKHAESFLLKGEKVRAHVHFKGRAIVYKDRGELLLLKFAQELDNVGKLEQMPKLEGKRMFIQLAPKAGKK